VEDGGRRTEDGGQRTEDGGRRAEDGGRRTEDGGRRAEGGGRCEKRIFTEVNKGRWIMTLAEKVRNEGIQQGIQQGLLEGITALIEIKFGESGLKLLPELRKIRNAD